MGYGTQKGVLTAKYAKYAKSGDSSAGDGWVFAHMFLAEYGRVPEKIIRAHSALGWKGRSYWGKVGSKNGNLVKSGKLI